ncbi:uncharacterized protein LDX57_004205 [Aspergillus melleus]|uniref:uncharacterized protein n=1 Tax=Aspergillus melleus TaxID=138277 RepID=UPI001E8E16EC|nr:uncharacterized protein LDX57_004205 [Aspergillus melleus]KAH8426468.1 hypothetical protein LDX57_004205 [Aspergillus melleus]
MAASRSWFRGPQPQTISFELPSPSRWRVLEKVNELEAQMDEYSGVCSYACIKYRCQILGDRTQTSYVRIYKQIYHFGTEADDPATRARQAVDWIPPELRACKKMTDKGSTVTPRLLGWRRDKQYRTGLVPGGFIVSLAWEELPGIQLGDDYGADRFWELEREERDRVRKAFKNTLQKIESLGIQPAFAHAKNLVWHSSSDTLSVVGFREPASIKRKPWSVRNFKMYGLVKVPKGSKWYEQDWDGDTSTWEF